MGCKVPAAKTKYVVISYTDGFSQVRFMVNELELRKMAVNVIMEFAQQPPAYEYIKWSFWCILYSS